MNRRITHILLIFVYCLLGCTKYYKEPYHPKLPPIQSNAIEDDLLKAAREGNLEGVTECIKQGANIQEKDEYGRSAGARALEAAVAAGNRELVDQLLSLGVSLSEIDKNGDSAGVHALKAAAAAGNEELVELFISLFVVKYKYGRDDIYREALEAAAEANQAKVADQIFRRITLGGKSSLLFGLRLPSLLAELSGKNPDQMPTVCEWFRLLRSGRL